MWVRWYPEDFEPGGLDLATKFESMLPGQSILRDSVLDPGLDVTGWSTGSALHMLSINSFAVDTLRLQQYMAGWSGRNLGVLSEYAPYFEGALGRIDVPMTLSMHQLIESLMLSTIGGLGQALSAIPNPYTKIAGAVIGMGTTLYSILAEGPTELPPFTIPAQEYNEQTDQDQFNTKVRAILTLGEESQQGASATVAAQAFDYTPMFMPRLVGDPVLEYRYQGGRLGVAFGLGKHGGVNRLVERDCEVYRKKGKDKARCDEDIPAGKSFTAAGDNDLGYVPGGVRITSVIQSFPTEDPQSSAPWYDPRCGSAITKANPTDVGAFYTSTNQGIQLMWDMCMKNSPQMFSLDTARLKSAWSDYIDAVLDGIVWLWNTGAKDDWGKGTWHAMIAGIATAFTTGVNGGQTIPGAIGTVSPDLNNCGALTKANDPLFFERWSQQNLYDGLIKPALDSLAARQRTYLLESYIAAYLPRPTSDDYVCGAVNRWRPDLLHTFYTARAAILDGYGKVAVNLEDVVDLGYRAQIEAARPKFGTFDITAAPKKVGPGSPSGRLTASPFPPTGDPPFVPPELPHRPAPGWSRLEKGLAVAAVGGGAAFLARHQLADLYRRAREAR